MTGAATDEMDDTVTLTGSRRTDMLAILAILAMVVLTAEPQR